MNKGQAKRIRLLIYLLVTWLLLWSFIRLLFFLGALTPGSIQESPSWLFVTVFSGILVIAWALGGAVLLSNWPRLSRGLVNLADSPGRASSTVWLLPIVAWFLAYSLFTVAWSMHPALVDGPVIVLTLFGFVILVVLVRHRSLGSGQDNLEPTEVRQSSPGRLGHYWNSLPVVAKNMVAVFLLALIVVFWFRDTLFNADVIVYGGDIFNQHYNLEAYVSGLLRTGQFPYWNPYIYSGTPFSGHPQSLVFYPPQLILRLLPLNLSISWALALHVWIAGVGMFALARWKGIHFWISFLCAMVYMLNGGLLSRVFAGHIWLVYALSWLPLVWLLIIIALNSGRISFIVAAAVGTSLIILTGHPAFPIYILLFFGFYWLWVLLVRWRQEKSWRTISEISGRFLAIMALAFGLSAVQIVPTLVYYSQVSLSQGYGAGGANFLAISLADLTALLVPDFYITGHQLGHYWELTPYVGILFLLLIPFSYAARRADWFRDYLSASAIASMAIALGSSIGIYFVLYYFLPPFRVARIPPRSLAIFIPTAILLGGIGLQTIVDRAASAKLLSLITRAYLFSCTFILGTAIGVWLDNSELVSVQLSDRATQPIQLVIGAVLLMLVYAKLAGLIPAQSVRGGDMVFASALSILGFAAGILVMPYSQPVARQLATLSLLVASFTLLLNSVYHRGARPFVVFGLVVLVFFDLFVSGRSYIRAAEPPVFYQDERLALKDVGIQEFDRVLSAVDEPDQYMLGQVGNIDGYNSGILSGYEQFLRGLSGAVPTSSPRILLDGSIPDPRALAFLGARYIFYAEAPGDELFEPIVTRDNIYLYENPAALPRAFVVYDAVHAASSQDAIELMRNGEFDFARQVVVEDPIHVQSAPNGKGVVDIVHYSEADGGMLMQVETNVPGILVLSEPYFSERSAWLNGRETELLRVNLGFIGVAVPVGTHDVELRYIPSSLLTGGAVTAFSIMVIVIALLYSMWRSSRRREDKLGPRF